MTEAWEIVQVVGGAAVLVWFVRTFRTRMRNARNIFVRCVNFVVGIWAAAIVENHESTWVYYFFDVQGNLLYVGITNDTRRRWEQHAEDKSWWHLVARKERVLYSSREEAERVEEHQIRTQRPMYNRAMNGWLR
jgi:predicted GIY-YIG superfamily endonuclease